MEDVAMTSKQRLIMFSAAHSFILKQGEDLVHAFQLVLEAYLIFDADASGLIDRDEVLDILKESTSHNHASRMARGGPAGGGSSALLSEERWREMDWDSDNSITFKVRYKALRRDMDRH